MGSWLLLIIVPGLRSSSYACLAVALDPARSSAVNAAPRAPHVTSFFLVTIHCADRVSSLCEHGLTLPKSPELIYLDSSELIEEAQRLGNRRVNLGYYATALPTSDVQSSLPHTESEPPPWYVLEAANGVEMGAVITFAAIDDAEGYRTTGGMGGAPLQQQESALLLQSANQGIEVGAAVRYRQ